MAKRKTAPETTLDAPAAALVSEPAPPPSWAPSDGEVVTEDKNVFIRIDGVRYEHVSDAPDGRWVYRRS